MGGIHLCPAGTGCQSNARQAGGASPGIALGSWVYPVLGIHGGLCPTRDVPVCKCPTPAPSLALPDLRAGVSLKDLGKQPSSSQLVIASAGALGKQSVNRQSESVSHSIQEGNKCTRGISACVGSWG